MAQALSRRGFVKGAVLGGAAAGCACASRALAEDGGWDAQYDVIVVGAGGAGMAAAIEAANAGCSVALLESRDIVGGNTSLCGGVIAGNNDRMSLEKGIEISNEEVAEWWAANPNEEISGTINPDVAKVIIEQAGPTIDWLLDLGVEFQDTVEDDPNYTTLPVIHIAKEGGISFRDPLQNGVEAAGAEILFETRATGLVADDSGRIVGVEALDKDGAPLKLGANKGVVLTTGGWAANLNMVEALNVNMKGVKNLTAPSVKGEGLAMAVDKGAITVRTSVTPQLFPSVNVDTGALIMWHVIQGGGIVVSDKGERFIREDTPNMTTGGARYLVNQINQQENPYYCMILQGSWQLDNAIEFYAPGLYEADSIEELAGYLDIDPEVLVKTVEDYNSYCADGVDPDFGREDFLIALDKPPFYGAKCDVRIVQTLGGLKIDGDAHVLKWVADENGCPSPEPIPGLYAAGEVVEWNAHAGWTVGSAFSIGRVAGKNAAAE